MIADNENAAKGNEIRELPLRLINKHKVKDTSKMKKGTFKEYSGYNPIPPSLKKRLPAFSRQFSTEKLESALKMLGDIDKRQKSAFSKDETELIHFIGHVIG